MSERKPKPEDIAAYALPAITEAYLLGSVRPLLQIEAAQ